MTRQALTALLCAAVTGTLPLSQLPVRAESVPGKAHLYINTEAPTIQDDADHTYILPSLPVSGVSVQTDTSSLPAAFDLRKKGVVSGVKNQGDYGTCWAFAACNAMETQLMETDTEADLSEWQLAYSIFNGPFGFPLVSENSPWYDQGGSMYFAMPTLTGWRGGIPESLCRYGDEAFSPETPLYSPSFHVKNATIYPKPNRENADFTELNASIKRSIYEGNSFIFSFYCNNALFSSKGGTCSYYNKDTLRGGVYHSVSVVGWDDDFPAENFSSDPGMNGAWLVKNSWGPEWGDHGYFWLSYADGTLYDIYSIDGNTGLVPEKQYCHDQYGYWSSMSIDEFGKDTDVFMASVFTPDAEERITAAMFYTLVADDQYTITIYTDLQDLSDPMSGTPTASVSGTCPLTGYHTISLAEQPVVQAGSPFSVVVRLQGDPGMHIATEASFQNEMLYSDGSTKITESTMTRAMVAEGFAEQQSFYCDSSMEWLDAFTDGYNEDTMTFPEQSGDTVYCVKSISRETVGNICLRAVAEPADLVRCSSYGPYLCIGDTITLEQAGGMPIYYQINDGSIQSYDGKGILFEGGEMKLSVCAGNPETADFQTYTYTAKPAELSSMIGDWAYSNLSSVTTTGLEITDTCLADQKTVLLHGDVNIKSVSLLPFAGKDVSVYVNGELVAPDTPYLWDVQGKKQDKLLIAAGGDGMTPTFYKLGYQQTSGKTAFLMGDVNGDSMVDASDAAEILVFAAAEGAGEDTAAYDEDFLFFADFTFNNAVDASDAAEILIYAAAAGTAAFNLK